MNRTPEATRAAFSGFPYAFLRSPSPKSQQKISVVAIVVGLFAFLSRRPGVLSRAAFFAEDGQEFFVSDLQFGSSALIKPYAEAGYLVLLPRLGAWLAGFFPYGWRPALYALFACACSVVACSLVLRSSAADVFGTYWRRVAVFGALLMLPMLRETHARLTNIAWWWGIGLMIVGLSTDPRRWGGKLFECLFVLVSGLSAPIGVVLLPFVAWRVWRRRTRWTIVICAAWIAAALTQLVVLYSQHRPTSPLPSVKLLSAVFVRQWFGPATVGTDYVVDHLNILRDPLWSRPAWLAALALGICSLALSLLSRNHLAGIVLMGGGAAQVVAGFVASGSVAFLLPDRYTVGPIACIVMLAASARPHRHRIRGLAVLGTVLQIAIGVTLLVAIPRNARIDEEPGYKSFSEAAKCLEKASDTACAIPAVPTVFDFTVGPNIR